MKHVPRTSKNAVTKYIAPIFKSGITKLKSLFDFSQRKRNVYLAEAKSGVGFSFPLSEVRGNKVQSNVVRGYNYSPFLKGVRGMIVLLARFAGLTSAAIFPIFACAKKL